MDKVKLLKELERRVKELPEKERNKFFGRLFTSIISALSKRLIMYEGYSVTKKIIEREVFEIGRRDARELIKKFNIRKKNAKNVSILLKIAALLLGYELEVRGNETYVKGCPFAIMAKELNEPLITEICSWYVNGIVKEIIGDKYQWVGYHNINKDIPECFFKRIKKHK